MMSKKTVTAVLVVIGFLLLAGVAFILYKGDNESPAISFSGTELSYTEGEDESVLLSNITAKDNVDGDVTASIRVDSITPLSDGKHAKVTYIVKDSSNNITTASQVVNYTASASESGQTNSAKDTGSDTLATDSASAMTASSETESQGSGTADSTSTAASTTGSTAASAAAANSETAGADTASSSGSTASAAPSTTPEPGGPTIKMKATSAKIGVNDSFEYTSYIESITDSKDTSSALYGNIILTGDYKTKKAGTYDIKIYVVDSDNNKSNVVDFILTRG
ncbi:MAG TPA: hypothetical protein PLN48_01545 [Lachnospiraceae bacterium]|nr:hypothetical protein [Lachnospiraceae bacterium]